MISIIVPIYNVELYLEKCIESIINQTYKDIEVILIMMVQLIKVELYVINMRRLMIE